MLRLRERWFPRRVDTPVGEPAEQEAAEAEQPPEPGAKVESQKA
jgi:hypothetical protein